MFFGEKMPKWEHKEVGKMKKIINIKNSTVFAVILLNFIFTTGVNAACNTEIGACRISDLRKAEQTEAIENKFLPPSQKRADLFEKTQTPAQTPEKSSQIGKFIKSLLKPSK